jgi:hypothetical protein
MPAPLPVTSEVVIETLVPPAIAIPPPFRVVAVFPPISDDDTASDVPEVWMPPPSRVAVQSTMLASVSVSEPELRMQPPSSALMPSETTIDWSASEPPTPTTKGLTVFPPDSVTAFPPLMVTLPLMVFWVVSVIVTALPQLNVTVPPMPSAVSNADSVQLAGDPVPTTPASAAGAMAAARTKVMAGARRVMGRHAVPPAASACQRSPYSRRRRYRRAEGTCAVGYAARRPRATTLSSRIGFTPSKIGSTCASTT